MWLVTFLFLSLFLMVINQIDKNTYGPYKLSWQKLETCKGPKKRDCGKFQMENIQNVSDLTFILDFPIDCPVTAAKVTLKTNQSDISKKLWNYSLNKPCQHFVLGPVLKKSFNLTNNCKINKGHYEIHLNFRETTTTFLGSSFFYGTYAFKTMSYNKMNNFFCVDTVVNVERISRN